MVPRTSVDTNVVADKGEDNRVEDVEMLSPMQSGRQVPVPSKYQVSTVNCGLHAFLNFFPPKAGIYVGIGELKGAWSWGIAGWHSPKILLVVCVSIRV